MAMEPTVKMHAACEECRGRKLRCSGHRPQCDRCKKDQATCAYSPQKRMGRPRKLKPRSPKIPERHPTCLEHPYITPEPVPHLRTMHYHQSEEQGLGSEWVQLFSMLETQMHSLGTHNSLVYDLNWPDREDTTRNCSLDRHVYDFENTLAPAPAAPIPNHLVTPHTPQMHPQHIHVPTLHIFSNSPDGSASFDYPSPEFISPSHILGYSLPIPPAPPVSIAGNSLTAANLNAHLTKSPIPFQPAISTSRSAIATATYSLSCQTCQSDGARNIYTNDVECISDMFLGTLLPMLCIFYTKALESIEQMTGNQKVWIEGQEVEIELETWKEMARLAMVKEASRVNKLVDEMGKLSSKNKNMIGGTFCYSADALWGPLCSKLSSLAQNARPCTMERVFAGDIGIN